MSLMPERFIPADAGNRSYHELSVHQLPVHPRGRGEQVTPVFRTDACRGSSPRTRGTAIINVAAIGITRFIPADAGNRFQSHGVAGARPVHPRGRGEQNAKGRMTKAYNGSSPRTRGTANGNEIERV